MPNPFLGNDEAAAFVAHLGSQGHINDQITRLHDRARATREESIRSVVHQMHPEGVQHHLIGGEELKRSLDRMVVREQERRREHLAAIEKDTYGSLRKPLSPIPDKLIAKRCYDDQMEKIRNRQEARAASKRVVEEKLSPAAQKKADALAAREKKFKVHHVDPTVGDGKRLLVYEEPLPPARSGSASPPKSARPPDELTKYFKRLSMPRPHQQSAKIKVPKFNQKEFTTFYKRGPNAFGAQSKSPG